MKKNEFRISEVPPGSVLLMGDVAVFSVEGGFCATQARCTHMQGLLNEGTFDGSTVTCPLSVDGEVGRVDVPLTLAVQSE